MGGGCHVYGDGSVTLTTGGLEMGQGLYTKIKQARPYDVILHLTCQAHADAPGMGSSVLTLLGSALGEYLPAHLKCTRGADLPAQNPGA